MMTLAIGETVFVKQTNKVLVAYIISIEADTVVVRDYTHIINEPSELTVSADKVFIARDIVAEIGAWEFKDLKKVDVVVAKYGFDVGLLFVALGRLKGINERYGGDITSPLPTFD